MKYSIIVGYRNKEINRVKLFLDSLKNQTNSDFELVFVNYFSDTNFQSDIKAILKNYNLNLNLIDLPPSGKIWNRANCLNIGADQSKNDILIFTDIDILFERNFLEKLDSKVEITNNTVYYYKCFFIDNKFKYDSFFDIDFKMKNLKRHIIKVSGINEKGLSIIPKEVFKRINGFDEYYRIWGFEDLDLFYRMENLKKLNFYFLSEFDFQTLHQWHPPSKNNIYLPLDWINFMRNYMNNNKKQIFRERIYSKKYYDEIDNNTNFVNLNLPATSPSSISFQLYNFITQYSNKNLFIEFKLTKTNFVNLLNKLNIRHVNSSIQYYYESFFYFILLNEVNWYNYDFLLEKEKINLKIIRN